MTKTPKTSKAVFHECEFNQLPYEDYFVLDCEFGRVGNATKKDKRSDLILQYALLHYHQGQLIGRQTNLFPYDKRLIPQDQLRSLKLSDWSYSQWACDANNEINNMFKMFGPLLANPTSPIVTWDGNDIEHLLAIQNQHSDQLKMWIGEHYGGKQLNLHHFDLAAYVTVTYGLKNNMHLQSLAKLLGLAPQNPHNALNDVKTTQAVLTLLRELHQHPLPIY